MAWPAEYRVSNNPVSGEIAWSQIVAKSCFLAGDRILLKRGEIFRGKLTLKACGTSPAGIIELSAYGSGAIPRLLESVTAKSLGLSWSLEKAPAIRGVPISYLAGKPIYKLGPIPTTFGAVKGLIYENEPMDFARSPDVPKSERRFTPKYIASISQIWTNPSDCGGQATCMILGPREDGGDPLWVFNTYGYEKNSYALVRTTPWSVHKIRINWVGPNSAFASYDSLAYPETSNQVDVVGNGVIFFGSLAMVTAPGEWHFDPDGRFLYFWPPNNLAPSNELAELIPAETKPGLGHVDVTLLDSVDLLMKDLSVENSSDRGVAIRFSRNASLESVTVRRSLGTGALFYKLSGDASVRASKFLDNANNGLELGAVTGAAKVYGNIFSSNGFVGNQAGYGMNFNSLRLGSIGKMSVAGNSMTGSGYAGIMSDTPMGGDSLDFATNKVQDFCLLLNDCGGIYVSGQRQSTTEMKQWIHGNTLSGGKGNTGGSRNKRKQSPGIYLDLAAHHFSVYQNQIASTESEMGGIFLNGGYSCEIYENTFGYESSRNHIILGTTYRSTQVGENSAWANNVNLPDGTSRPAIYGYDQ